MAHFQPSTLAQQAQVYHAALARRNYTVDPLAQLRQAQQAQEATKGGKKEKGKKSKLSSMDLKKVKEQLDKYRRQYKDCAADLDRQGLPAYPDTHKGIQTVTCKDSFKQWKKYEAEVARRAVKSVFKTAAEQKAALNAANAAALQSSSEETAVAHIAASYRIPKPLALDMIQPGMNARRTRSEGVGRAKRRAKKKGTSEASELAAVPSDGEILAESEAAASESSEDEDEGWGWTPWIAGGVILLGTVGGAAWWFRRKTP